MAHAPQPAPNVQQALQHLVRLHGLSEAAYQDLIALFDPGESADATQYITGDITYAGNAPTEPHPDASPVGAYLGRYRVMAEIGKGGMGRVYRVWDANLERTIAMKVIAGPTRARALARFSEEARIMAGLAHPNIVPVYEIGTLSDGRLYFTMKEVHGQTLKAVITALHQASTAEAWGEANGGWTFRRVVDVLHGVCEAMAFAHRWGVVHRDLKPANIMVGSFGEVQVMDWGLAKPVDEAAGSAAPGQVATAPSPGARPPPEAFVTRPATQAGVIAGTPAYMAPEQAEGRPGDHGPTTDVYNLGAILYHVLKGEPPGPPTPRRRPSSGPWPPRAPWPLIEICKRAMAPDPRDRPQDAAALATALGSWLEGRRRRDEALAVVADALPHAERAKALHQAHTTHRAAADAAMGSVPTWAPVAAKEPGWQLEAEAQRLQTEQRLAEIEHLKGLRAALSIDPNLAEAHAALAAHHRRAHSRAEAAGDDDEAKAQALLLRTHDRRGSHRAYLEGRGILSLATHPPGATLTLQPVEDRHGRFIPLEPTPLGHAPLDEHPIHMGRYRLTAEAEGFHPLHIPLCVARQQAVSFIPPGATGPCPIPLLPLGALGKDDVYVPQGWFTSGGDDEAPGGTPRRAVWLDGFVIERFPVSNGDYLRFLNDRVQSGRGDEALRHAPRERGGSFDTPGALIYGRGADGRFYLQRDADGDLWEADQAVTMVDWHGAQAYAQWRQEQTGLPWRLPFELEWEKAARGVDGRQFPWGSRGDGALCCVRESFEGTPASPSVHDFPTDKSPYGVRGMAGNVMDWCEDHYQPGGAPIDAQGRAILDVSEGSGDDSQRVLKGGSWGGELRSARAAARVRFAASFRYGILGFRLCRPLT